MKWIIGTSAVAGMAILTLGFMLVSTGSLATENPDGTRKLASTLTTSGNGTSEGIRVHGDWTIEVSDPDGTLVEKREFENEFKGGMNIEEILTREKRPGTWGIFLTGPIASPGQGNGEFEITEPTSTDQGFSDWNGSKTLTVSGGGDGTVILQGELTVSEVGAAKGVFSSTGVFKVATKLTVCEIEATLSECLSVLSPPTYGAFTTKDLQPPITAKEGQKVNVTVQISFD